MDENENLDDWVFQTHRCKCGWAGDEDELVNDAGETYDEVSEMATPRDFAAIDLSDFCFCPSCYGEPTAILE